MKVCTFECQTSAGPVKRLGVLSEDGKTIIDVNAAWAIDYEREGRYNPFERANYKMPSSLWQLLQIHDDPIDALEESYGLYLFLQKVGVDSSRKGVPIAYQLDNPDVSLRAPLDRISTYRDFYAHEKHVKAGFDKRKEEVPPAWYEIPAYYKGATQGFIGPEEEVLWPKYTDILDYELELGVVIGQEGINIKEMDAVKHIFGFTILNDISARDIQKKEMAIRLGPAKGKDFCSIIGPVITTIDEFDGKEPDLLMTAKINGEEWSRGQSGDSHFSFAQMITHVAQDEWVLPGDLFGSGTVGTGCGLELDRWIQPGDKIELSVEGIGTLVNTIGSKKG